MAFSPRGPETQIYSVTGTDLDLVGTAEITLGGMHMDEILEEDDLPLKVAGISHCFRTEAGSHGRESKGLYRVHQFSKVEMFVYCRPEESEAMHDELVAITGIGHKLADCIGLFALWHTEAIPVDTHLWQAAVRHYFPEWQGK